MSDEKLLRVSYVSPRRHGEATRQAHALSAKVIDFLALGGMKVEIEVKSEETIKLREEVRSLRRQLGIKDPGYPFIFVDEV